MLPVIKDYNTSLDCDRLIVIYVESECIQGQIFRYVGVIWQVHMRQSVIIHIYAQFCWLWSSFLVPVRCVLLFIVTRCEVRISVWLHVIWVNGKISLSSEFRHAWVHLVETWPNAYCDYCEELVSGRRQKLFHDIEARSLWQGVTKRERAHHGGG